MKVYAVVVFEKSDNEQCSDREGIYGIFSNHERAEKIANDLYMKYEFKDGDPKKSYDCGVYEFELDQETIDELMN